MFIEEELNGGSIYRKVAEVESSRLDNGYDEKLPIPSSGKRARGPKAGQNQAQRWVPSRQEPSLNRAGLLGFPRNFGPSVVLGREVGTTFWAARLGPLVLFLVSVISLFYKVIQKYYRAYKEWQPMKPHPLQAQYCT